MFTCNISKEDAKVHNILGTKILHKMQGGRTKEKGRIGKIKNIVVYFQTNIENLEDIREHYTSVYPRLKYFIDFLKFYISVLLKKAGNFPSRLRKQYYIKYLDKTVLLIDRHPRNLKINWYFLKDNNDLIIKNAHFNYSQDLDYNILEDTEILLSGNREQRAYQWARDLLDVEKKTDKMRYLDDLTEQLVVEAAEQRKEGPGGPQPLYLSHTGTYPHQRLAQNTGMSQMNQHMSPHMNQHINQHMQNLNRMTMNA